MEDKFTEKLTSLIKNYEDLRFQYRNFTNNSDGNKTTFNEFQGRFNDIKADLRDYHTYFTREWIRRDDKAATAIKFRIAVAMTRGEYETDDKEEKAPSITTAEKLASGSKEYREFVDQRGFYRESLTNISDIREEINSYVNEIKDRMK